MNVLDNNKIMKLIKKIIAGFVLTLCFTTSVFAVNITTIALELNECFFLIEQMAHDEYKNHAGCEFSILRIGVDKELISFCDSLLEFKEGGICNLNKFINETISIAYKFKENMLSNFKQCRVYENENVRIKSLYSSDNISEIFPGVFRGVFNSIYYYLKQYNKFSETEYLDFMKGFDEELLLSVDDKKILFNTLIKCTIEK